MVQAKILSKYEPIKPPTITGMMNAHIEVGNTVKLSMKLTPNPENAIITAPKTEAKRPSIDTAPGDPCSALIHGLIDDLGLNLDKAPISVPRVSAKLTAIAPPAITVIIGSLKSITKKAKNAGITLLTIA